MNEALIAKLGLDRAGFDAGLKAAAIEAQKAQEKMAEDAKRIAAKRREEAKRETSEGGSKALDLGKEVLGAAGISLGIAGFEEMAKSAVEAARHVKDVSEAIGVSTDEVQTLGYALSQTGVNQETFEHGLTKLSEHMGEARNGNEALVDTFAKLGVTWEDLHRLSPDDVFRKISDAGASAGDETQKLALYMEVLGKSGAKMAGLLNQGSAAIKELQAEMHPVKKEDIDIVDKFGNSVSTLWQRIKAGSMGAVADFLKVTQAYSETGGGTPIVAAPGKDAGHSTGEDYGPHEKDFRSIPTDPTTRARLNEQADLGAKNALQESKAGDANSDNEDENDARRLEAAKAIKAIQNETDYAHMQALATITSQTSKLAALDQEDALTHRQIADAKEKLAAESDDTKKAAIAKEISGLENKGLETDEKRVELQLRLADAAQEIEFSLQQQNIDRLKGLSAASDVLAREQEIDLIGKRIAKNSADMKNADELRTLELRRQNVELRTSQQILEAANKAKYVADHEKTPQDLNAQHAEDHKKETLGKAWERAQERKRRHEAGLDGSAQPDAGNQSVQPKNYRSQDDPSKHSPILPKGVGKSMVKLPPMPDRSFKPGGKTWDGKAEDPLHPGHTTMPPTHMPDRSFSPDGKTWNGKERPDAPAEPIPKPEPYNFPGYNKDTLHPGSGLSSSGAGKVDFKEVLTALGRIEQNIQKVGEDV